ncbi:hypothetical protein JW977_01215 [Candidatus Falkowbacteria bacterium]|nr:hypothetical protein [Candidatus Falkowbacteria bacterium]
MEQENKEPVLLRSLIKCPLTTIPCSNCIYLKDCKERAKKKLKENQRLVIPTD